MPRYPKKATFRTFVIDKDTGEWKQVEIKDIPEEKKIEFWDRFAAALGYERVKDNKENVGNQS